MSDLLGILRQQCPNAVDFISEMPLGSARRAYCTRYFAYRLTGAKRPAASGYALGLDHAFELRMMVEECLPAEIRDLQRP